MRQQCTHCQIQRTLHIQHHVRHVILFPISLIAKVNFLLRTLDHPYIQPFVNVYSRVYGIPAVSVGQLSPDSAAPDLFNNVGRIFLYSHRTLISREQRVIKTHRRRRNSESSAAEQAGFRNARSLFLNRMSVPPDSPLHTDDKFPRESTRGRGHRGRF